MVLLLFKGPSSPDMIQYREDMDFDSSLMELPKSSSALPSELQIPIRMHSSMPSNNKIQQVINTIVSSFHEELFAYRYRLI